MDFPSLETLEQRNIRQIALKFPHLEPQGKGILEAMARMHAGAMHLVYGMIDYHVQQLFPQSAEAAFLDNLLTWRAIPRLHAQKAVGNATVNGRIGSRIREGSTILGSNGVRYAILEETELLAEHQVLRIRALEPGAKANCEGLPGQWESPQLGVGQKLLLSAASGSDLEGDDAYRLRALDLIQNRGSLYGKKGDYAAWAQEASSEVAYAFEVTNFRSSTTLGLVIAAADLTPLSADAIDNVRTLIEERKLTGVMVDVLEAEPKVLNWRLKITPDTPDLRIAVVSALETYIKERMQPQGQIALSKVKERLEGSVEGLMSLAIHAPSSDISTSEVQLPVLGATVWI